MKRKWIYMIALFLIIGIAFIYFMTGTDSSIPDSATKLEVAEKEAALEEQVKIEKEEEKAEKRNETETEETEQRAFPQIVTEAVQGTVDFFTKRETHIVAIGDSLTHGVGDETEQHGYVGILDRTINGHKQIAHIDNFGKRGNRTDHLLMRLEDDEIASSISDSDIVLMTIGANDIMQVVKENFTNLVMEDFVFERDGYEERLREIFDEILRLNPNTEIYLLGFYNPFKQYFDDIEELDLIVETWNTTGNDVASDYENATYIPTDDLFTDETAELFSDDNFHPNYEGYYRIAERVLEYITIR
ncbi:SGNH/GDSL hydrolase family protein [Oceanobacillus rekensis]|uniref:SGNH/GDSL hydrolase family protein n=1 Tax=Oceanobacillus rekensis TaxID=937927 RepID=UPI000B44862B|nr:SGNH/GDSL hydrolase family protein [Oceanobacillus rekensis]